MARQLWGVLNIGMRFGLGNHRDTSQHFSAVQLVLIDFGLAVDAKIARVIPWEHWDIAPERYQEVYAPTCILWVFLR